MSCMHSRNRVAGMRRDRRCLFAGRAT